MSMVTQYRCDACGGPVDASVAFLGIHQSQVTVASGGVHAWHACSPACAAKHMRAVADGIERVERERVAARHAVEEARKAAR